MGKLLLCAEVMLEHKTHLSLDRETGGDPAEPPMDPAKK